MNILVLSLCVLVALVQSQPPIVPPGVPVQGPSVVPLPAMVCAFIFNSV